MPFEVFTVPPPDASPVKSTIGRGAEQVGREIQSIYEKVAGYGGKIVAEHHIHYEGNFGVKKDFLFLVAEIPENKDTSNQQLS